MTQLNSQVVQRIENIVEYILKMERERDGYGGTEVRREIHDTMESFITSLPIMLRASSLWCDGTNFSFAGELETISFGMIARTKRPVIEGMVFVPLEWTFHS